MFGASLTLQSEFVASSFPSRQWSFVPLVCLSRAAPAACGDSQARGRTGALAAGLCHSHSNPGSKPCLQPIPQLTATPDSEPTEGSQICFFFPPEPESSWILVGFVAAKP